MKIPLARRGFKCFVFGCTISSFSWFLIFHVLYKCDYKRNPAREYLPTVQNHLILEETNDLIGLVNNEKDLKKRDEGYRKHAFNLLISDRIGLHREIPNTADKRCQQRLAGYPKLRKNASIVICFHNEAWSTLLRTVYSILDRTPLNILHEIILLDDFSDHSRLIQKLPTFLESNLPKLVKHYRTQEREGLIRARLLGAKYATGDVLVFLDSHCEVNKNWLEPLLDRIQEDRKHVVCPVIDMISADTFTYSASPLVRGGFNWGMHFSWEALPPGSSTNPSEPYKSPTMAGGLFAMDRNYFFQLGGYDEGMNIWGGENLEISFRIWMCGGTLEIIPCSRIGHIFRNRRPYSDDGKGDTMIVNSVRLVNVWLDEYKEHFYKLQSKLKLVRPDVTSRLELRKKLNCKTFKWYLEEVYPEIGIPMSRQGLPFERQKIPTSEVLAKGKVQNIAMKMCLDTDDDPLKKKSLIVVRRCEQTKSRSWTWNSIHEMKINGKLCLSISLFEISAKAHSMKCHGDKSDQEWKYNKSAKTC